MGRRILLLGASGFIGGYLFEHLVAAGNEVTGTCQGHPKPGLRHLDLLQVDSLVSLLASAKPELVVFLSGTKDVGRCEREPSYAVDLNVQAVRNYLLGCTMVGLRPATVFFSTDYVFDGAAGYCTSTTAASPKTVYGATNMIAERLFHASDLPTLILRVSAVMGRRSGFYRWLEESLQSDTPVALFDNTYFTPTTIGRLCNFVTTVVQQGIQDGVAITHLSDGYRMTRFEFGQLLASKLSKPQALVSAVKADIDGVGFQSDLSLLPDGMTEFLDNKTWDELGGIF